METMKEELEYEIDCLEMEHGHEPAAITVLDMLRQWSSEYGKEGE